MQNHLINFMQAEYESRRYISRDQISFEEKKKIVQYLENPVSCGLWHLNADWLPNAGITEDIWMALKEETNGKDKIAIRSGKRQRYIGLNEVWWRKISEELHSTISFVVGFFDYLARQDAQQPEDNEQFGAEHETVQQILDLIDIEPIKKKYSEALELFKSSIWHSEFKAIMSIGDPIRLNRGTFLIQKGPRDGCLAAISWDPAPLNDLKGFLSAVGKVANTTLMPVFSPEEEVFAPYFIFLGMAFDLIIPQEHLRPLVGKAVAHFTDENYTDCVSAIGLASEDVLTQIYETLYREQLTKGLTLGQLADELHAKAAARFKKKEESVPDFSSLYPDIKAAVDDANLSPARVAELLRKLLNLSAETNRHLQARIDKIGKPERRVAIWPELVNHSVNELIRYRNAASHKSRIPIGPMECRRAVFSFVVLLRWWLRERTLIDWSKSADEILKDSVERHSKG
ncbi:hypothetical protein [Pseudogulbenkiania ferrooxidans]|uniref:Uncharacterized protein n=1 Tax=Pseudogulbenkiania ferrooxidans 2002 TaxID=279714 RepID=B9Z322_9NEIS|nr:hypothetical protein [Pseudogulbenkiania ferrooxidans]EEG08975.1 hypothetical protein FuraDRAFT_1735 [Pseudogulbenkiania ferrooxidans 2002]